MCFRLYHKMKIDLGWYSFLSFKTDSIIPYNICICLSIFYDISFILKSNFSLFQQLVKLKYIAPSNYNELYNTLYCYIKLIWYLKLSCKF